MAKLGFQPGFKSEHDIFATDPPEVSLNTYMRLNIPNNFFKNL